MLTNLKIKTRSFGNRIKQITLLEWISTQKSKYGLEVFILKRDYSIEIKVNSEKVLLNKLISKETKQKFQKDFNFNESVNLNKKSSNLELNLIVKEKEWKEIWNQKFNKYKKIGKYLPTISDRLFFSYLQERKLNLKSKYTFNNFLSSSKIVNYSFQTNKKVNINSLYKLLKSFFKTLKSLISFPILKNTPNKFKILLFYYVIPNKTILKAKQNYNQYIRKDDKLFKDTILRTKLIKIMSRYKMILFLSKWKENNNTIKLSNLNNKTSSLSIPLVYKIQDSLLENTNFTNQEIEILRELGLSINNISEKEQRKLAILSIKTVQYNLSKLIPFYKKLVTLLFETDFKLLLENNHLKNIKIFNSNHCIKINKILANNIFNKLSLNKELNIDKLTDTFDILKIRDNIDKEKKLIKISTIENNLEKISLEINISKLQLENSPILNSLKISSLHKIVLELVLLYSELNSLKEKMKIQDLFKNNYKKDIVYSLIFLNKLVLFFIKLKKYKTVLAAKQKEFSKSNDNKFKLINFKMEGLEELNLENLEKFYHSYSNLKINRKIFNILQEKKEIYNYLNLPSITEILSLIKEQNFEFSEEPLIMNYSNPYGYKNANLLLIIALHSLYRAILIEHLNKTTKEEKIESDHQKKLLINDNYKFNVNELTLKDSLNKIRVYLENLDNYNGINESKQNLLSKVESNNGTSLISLNKIKFKYLISFLEKIFNKSIELELIRLKYPAHNSNILAQILAISSNKLKFFTMMRKLLYNVNIKQPGVLKHNFNIIPSYLSGIKVRLGGRLSTENLIPRKTVKTYQIGSIARNKTNYRECSRITLKNKRGAYSFTVITSHIFNTNKKIKY
uniref:Small ribosomal subunit protein uS3m n=1 Tax=Mutinus fleischeri TaxID=2218478 RepID=A0A8K1VCF7_9AGAM|nr:ribosomal protein S3 [Mutinus fleischeri]